MLAKILVLALAYGLGSISFSWLIVRLLKGTDLRQQGSGNLGAKNTLRATGVIPALAVMLADAGKGWLALHLSSVLAPDSFLVLPAAVFVILGHNFPFWLKFRGGKGLASLVGVLLYLNPILMGVMVLTAGVVLVLTRKPNPAAMITVLLAPAFLQLTLAQPWAWLWGLALAAPILYRHKQDVPELLQVLKLKA